MGRSKPQPVLANGLVVLISDVTIRYRVQGISNGGTCFVLTILLPGKEETLVY